MTTNTLTENENLLKAALCEHMAKIGVNIEKTDPMLEPLISIAFAENENDLNNQKQQFKILSKQNDSYTENVTYPDDIFPVVKIMADFVNNGLDVDSGAIGRSMETSFRRLKTNRL